MTDMNVTIRAAQLNAQEIEVGDVITLQEVRLTGTGVLFRSSEAGAAIHIESVQATMILTESSLNRFLAGRNEEPLQDLQVAMLTGKVRISGRYKLGFVPLPFSLTAVPEIEGGARLRLDPRQMSFVVPLPGVAAQVLGERINTRLARSFDTTKLPLPGLRLTGLTVEPGRVLLSATASLELRPTETGVVKREQPIWKEEG